MNETYEQLPVPESPFLRKQVRKWRKELFATRISAFACLALISVLPVTDLVSGPAISPSSVWIIIFCFFSAILIVHWFEYSIKSGSTIAYQLMVDSIPFRYLVHDVDTTANSRGTMSTRIGRYLDKTTRFPKVNENLEVRIGWFSFNAYPRMYPWCLAALSRIAGSGRAGFLLHIYKREGDGVDTAYTIMISAYLLMAISGPLTFSIDGLFIYSFLFLIIVIMFTAIFVSHISYRAAFIRLLSDRWPWERD